MQLNPVTWTLGVEAAFYLALPLLALRFRAWVPVLLVGATVAWNLVADGFLAGKTLPAWAGHFACGMLVAVWASRGRSLSARASAVLVCAGSALVGLDAWMHETAAPDSFVRAGLSNLPAAAGFALIVAAAAAGRGPAVAWLRARWLATLGLISYGVYLWHVPVLLALRDAGMLPAGPLARLALALPVALALGALSWRFVERPALRLGRRRAQPGAPAATGPRRLQLFAAYRR
jgi:peptidoglycan/LPS O-acetylase OafA/YrhL